MSQRENGKKKQELQAIFDLFGQIQNRQKKRILSKNNVTIVLKRSSWMLLSIVLGAIFDELFDEAEASVEDTYRYSVDNMEENVEVDMWDCFLSDVDFTDIDWTVIDWTVISLDGLDLAELQTIHMEIESCLIFDGS